LLVEGASDRIGLKVAGADAFAMCGTVVMYWFSVKWNFG